MENEVELADIFETLVQTGDTIFESTLKDRKENSSKRWAFVPLVKRNRARAPALSPPSTTFVLTFPQRPESSPKFPGRTPENPRQTQNIKWHNVDISTWYGRPIPAQCPQDNCRRSLGADRLVGRLFEWQFAAVLRSPLTDKTWPNGACRGCWWLEFPWSYCVAGVVRCSIPSEFWGVF